MGGFSANLMSGSSLLSHGETPHYHRRYGVSLLSSAWGQVGPPRYCRQTNSVRPRLSFLLNQNFNLEQAVCPSPFGFSLALKINSISLLENTFGVVRLSLTVH